MKKWLNFLQIVMVLLGAIVVYWRFFNGQISHVKYLQQQTIYSNISNSNTALEKIVLGYHAGIHFNFDGLVKESEKLNKLQVTLRDPLSRVKPAPDLIKKLENSLAAKIKDTETFKSHHAVLHNSVRSAVFLANRIRHTEQHDKELIKQVNQIIEGILKVRAHLSGEAHKLEVLSETYATYIISQTDKNEELLSLNNHLLIVIDYQKKIENDIRNITSTDVKSSLEAVRSALEQAYTIDRKVSEKWDTYIFILSILTICIVVVLIMILKSKARELERFNVELEQKVLERTAELEGKNQVLTQLNDSLDSFVYRVSHDLKAPIVSILGILKLLDQSIETKNEKTLKALKFLEQLTNKFQVTISDMLELSRVDRKLQEEKEQVQLDDLLQEVLRENQSLVESSNLQITSDFTYVSELYMARIDAKSIFHNLISNSMKYKHPDHPASVDIKTKKEGGKLTLVFSDNGIGIDTIKYKEKLFGMFKRFSTQAEGTGVGLYMIKKIIENYGGTISLESEPGKGSVFTIEFKEQ